MFLIPPIGMMKQKLAPAEFVSYAWQRADGGTDPLVVDKPAGTQEDDLLVAFIGETAQGISSGPAGWTQQETINATFELSLNYLELWTKVALAGEGASYSWTLGGAGGDKIGIILCYRPLKTDSPVDVSDSKITGNFTNSHVLDGLTTNYNQARLVHGWWLNRDGALNVDIGSGPSGATQRAAIDGDAIGRDDLMLAVYDEVLEIAGSSGTRTLTTISSDVRSLGADLAIRAKGT